MPHDVDAGAAPVTELLVVRHGETDFNRQHRFQGQVDVPLNANGLAQARRLAERLRDEPLDLVVASDLSRAQATAQAVLDAHADRGLVLQVDAGWREQGFGAFEGLDGPTIRAQHAQAWGRWLEHGLDYALPGGAESNRAFHRRVTTALAALLAAHPGRRLAVFTHGGVLDMLWRSAKGQSLSGVRTVEIPNTGVNRLRWTGAAPTAETFSRDGEREHDAQAAPVPALAVVHWGDADHLDGLDVQSTVWKVPPALRP